MSSVISQLQNQIMVQIKEERLFRESLWKSGLDLLQEKIYREIHYRNLPSEHPFIRVSIKWIPGFQHFLSSCGFGNVVQPTKDFRSSSPITIIEIVTNEELQKIFEQEREEALRKLGKVLQYEADYFLNNPYGLEEVIAETYAILSGLSHNDIKSCLGMRTNILMQYFPKTITYIANRSYKE